jgi:hypothetical protein
MSEVLLLKFVKACIFEAYNLLGSKTVKSKRSSSTFRRNVLPPCLGSIRKRASDQQEASNKHSLTLVGFLFALPFNHENGGSTLLRNVGEVLRSI